MKKKVIEEIELTYDENQDDNDLYEFLEMQRREKIRKWLIIGGITLTIIIIIISIILSGYFLALSSPTLTEKNPGFSKFD